MLTSGCRMQRSVRDEAIHGVASLETRIDADYRLWPETVAGVKFPDLRLDVGRSDLRERTGKTLVVAHERLIQVEDVHGNQTLSLQARITYVPRPRKPRIRSLCQPTRPRQP